MTEILKPKDIWREGIPLDSAWNVFASEKEKSDLAALETQQPNSEIDPDRPIVSAILGLAAIPQFFKEQERVKSDLIETFRSGLLQDLEEEGLYGFGVLAPPSTARMPQKIESIFWINPSLDWSDNSGSSARNSFIHIRIIVT